MKKMLTLVLASIGCFMLLIGCAGKNKVEIQKELMTMSDSELVHHYEMLELRMNDIDRARQQSIEQPQAINSGKHPQEPYNHLGHLHIGDTWNELKKERRLTLIEMRNRGISPP